MLIDCDTNKSILKQLCIDKHIVFTRYFFKHRENAQFIVNPHHQVMADTMDRVFRGEITRLIINVPPGYTKTEMAVLSFIARGLAYNPDSKFIHTSYADSLALQNSLTIRDIVLSHEYQELWPLQLRKDNQSKKSWYTEQGGGVLAVASGGTITGFRAGRMVDGFSGAIVIDDPLKPDDAYSDAKRNRVNNRIMNTLKSRLAHEKVPIILIMQRLHEEDCTGFLVEGGTGEKWHHLVLPAEIEKDYVYPSAYKYGIPIKHNLEVGPLWPYKHTLPILNTMRKADPYTTSSQYDQRPSPLGGGIFKDEWWSYYNEQVPPQFEYRFITGDTAQKKAEHNDRSVFGCFGVYKNNLYIIDVVKSKWEAPELRRALVDMYNKHKHATAPIGRLRWVHIEDKASGTDLIQSLKREGMPIKDIQRNRCKVARAHDTVPYLTSGFVHLPNNAPWLSDFKDEIRKFTPMGTHKYDDQVDMFMDGVEIGLMTKGVRVGTF